MMNQRKAGAMLSYVYLAITFAIGIIYTPLLLKFLGDSEYGVYSVASSAIAFLAILDLGFSQTMVRYVARYKALGDKDGEKKIKWYVFDPLFHYRSSGSCGRNCTVL